jgi:hypothetical protein
MENVEKLAEELNEKIEGFKAQLENAVSKEDVSKILEDLEALKNDDTAKFVTELQEKVSQLEEKSNATEKEKMSLAKEIKDNVDVLKLIAKGDKSKTFVSKALVTRASVANSPAGFVLPDIGQLGVKERSLYDVLPKVSVPEGNHTGKVRYRDWDEATIVRAAATVAEGNTFPESTAAFAWYNKDLRKIGDTLPVTEEFFEDEQQAAGELSRFLEINVNTEIDDQLVNGDNVGQNLDGILNSVPAYTAVASGITDANIKDLAIKVKNTITRTRGSKYRPDMILMASSTFEDSDLKKDENNNYIFDENAGTIGGLAIVIDENMPDNQLIVGDRRFATIYEMAGVVLSEGYSGTQFVEDEMTIKARKRMLFLIREVDKTGFLKVTDVDAALATLASAP